MPTTNGTTTNQKITQTVFVEILLSIRKGQDSLDTAEWFGQLFWEATLPQGRCWVGIENTNLE